MSLLAHLVVLAALLLSVHGQVDRLTGRSDLDSYMDVAAFIADGTPLEEVWSGRVFPGWPLAFCFFQHLWPTPWPALIMALLIAVALPLVYWQLERDTVGATLMTIGTPTLLLHSTMGMGEPLYLLLLIMGLRNAQQGRMLSGGFWNGLAALIRPTAVFLTIAVMVPLARQKRWADLLRFTLMAGLMAGMLFVVSALMFNDPMHCFHSYSSLSNVGEASRQGLGLQPGQGSHFGPPLVYLVKTTLLPETATWKIAFVWTHVVALAAILVLGFRQRNQSSLHMMAFIWALGTAIFIFCTGPYWAFHSFDRYFTWALPAYYVLIRPLLPKSSMAIAGIWLGMLILTAGRAYVG